MNSKYFIRSGMVRAAEVWGVPSAREKRKNSGSLLGEGNRQLRRKQGGKDLSRHPSGKTRLSGKKSGREGHLPAIG